MQCPDCGYDADPSSIFCPQCRHQFRDIPEDPYMTPDTPFNLPAQGYVTEGPVADETLLEEQTLAFTPKELRQMDLQLLSPAILVVLIIALFTYTVISSIPFVPLTIGGLNFGITGIISLACGLFFGILFLVIQRRSLRKFQYR